MIRHQFPGRDACRMIRLRSATLTSRCRSRRRQSRPRRPITDHTGGIMKLLLSLLAGVLAIATARGVRRRRMRQPRRARHDVLRREQGSRRRRPGRPEEVEEPVDDRVHLHAGGGSRRLREHLQAVHAHLAKCLDKKVVFYQVQNNAAEIEAMRSGRLHVGGFSTGPTAFAVNLAGAIPFAIKGTEKEFQGYNLIVIVKASSPYQKLSDLKGKKFAHTAPSSNSGHLAPLALFPARAWRPRRITSPCSPASTTSRCSAWAPATTTPRSRLRRIPSHGRARPDQGVRLPRDLSQPEIPDVVVRLRARPRAEARRQDAHLLLRLPLSRRRW